MTTPATDLPVTDCTKCDEVRIGKELDAQEAVLAHQREVEKTEDAAGAAIRKADWDSEFALRKVFHEAVTDATKASLDRTRDSAKYVQTAAAGIGTLYTGALALAFSVTDNPLPIRGAWAMAFLGLAVALATGYLAFLTKPDAPPMDIGGDSLVDIQMQRTTWFTQWVSVSVLDRRWAIRASVIALLFGVAFIPAGFVASARVPEVPAAPVAPAIPATIAAAVQSDAVRLYAAQVTEFEAATDARNNALAEQAKALKNVKRDERRIDNVFARLAAVALVGTVFGPIGWGLLRDRKRPDCERGTPIPPQARLAGSRSR